MKTKLILYFGFLLLVALHSCKESFLDSPPKDTVPRQVYAKDLQSCNEVLNGLYLKLSSGAFVANNVIYPELIADNLKPVTGGTTMLNMYTWKQQEDATANAVIGTNNINGYSYAFYQLISISNFIIEKTNEFRNENPERADDILGQALAIRALSHFMLVSAFAQAYNFSTQGGHIGIVYQKNADWTLPVPRRHTVSEVYNFMIADLNDANRLLSNGVNTTLRISKPTVHALLARVYLFKEDYAKAIQFSRQITEQVPLMTIANGYPNDLYKTLVPSRTEVLLHLVPLSSVSLGYSSGGSFAGRSFRSPILFNATNDIALILTENVSDVRAKWVTKVGNDWNVLKFPTGIIPDVTVASTSYFHTVIRASEAYLTAAEAYANINRADSARYFLDLIRKRADPSVVATTVSGKMLLDAIYRERRKEMAFDGLRMFDLLRWKQGVMRTDGSLADAKTLPYPSDKAIAPIPGLDIQTLGLKQNQGY